MSEKETARVLILGAGPSGLAMAWQLQNKGIFYEILEKGGNPAQSWHDHYDRLRLHTVKKYSALPGMPFPKDYPRYVPRLKLLEYFKAYAETFKIHPHYHQNVTSVRKNDNGLWTIQTDKDIFCASCVVLATGYNRLPRFPEWADHIDFTGQVIHSDSYQNGSPYSGQKVLVVGMGNTGAEIALDLCEHGASPTLSVRNPVNIVPLEVMGRPIQTTAILLSKLPNWLTDFIGKQVQKRTIGDLSSYGLITPEYAPTEQVRRTGKIPVIDIGTVEKIKSGKIKVQPGIKAFRQGTVLFENGSEKSFDSIILATGYRSGVQELLRGHEKIFNAQGNPKSLFFKQIPGLYFLGFTTTSSGILRSISHDSAIIADHIANKMAGN